MFTHKARWLAAALAWVILAGCQPLTAPPPPTPIPIRIQYTPALAPRLAAMHTCADAMPGVGLLVDELPAGHLDPTQADLVFRLGQPDREPGFTAAIGEDEVVAIVNPANPAALRAADLAAIFAGQVRDWNDLQPAPNATQTTPSAPNPIQIWSYPAGDDVRDAFLKSVLPGAAIAESAGLVPDPTAMLDAVAGDPSAIGYLTRSLASDRVKIVNISGENPHPTPLLALAQSEPQGPARALLACMQKN